MAFSCGGFFCNGYRPGITHKNFQIFAGPESGMTVCVGFVVTPTKVGGHCVNRCMTGTFYMFFILTPHPVILGLDPRIQVMDAKFLSFTELPRKLTFACNDTTSLKLRGAGTTSLKLRGAGTTSLKLRGAGKE